MLVLKHAAGVLSSAAGTCSTACPAGATCVKGACKCPKALPDVCKAACVSLAADSSNCGELMRAALSTSATARFRSLACTIYRSAVPRCRRMRQCLPDGRDLQQGRLQMPQRAPRRVRRCMRRVPPVERRQLRCGMPHLRRCRVARRCLLGWLCNPVSSRLSRAGECGKACPAGAACEEGVCTCPPAAEPAVCANTCVSLASTSHCGEACCCDS